MIGWVVMGDNVTQGRLKRQAAYNHPAHKLAKQNLKDNPQLCRTCGLYPAVEIDHQPPVSSFPLGEWVGELVPSCRYCNRSHGARILPNKGKNQKRKTRQSVKW